MRNNIIVPQLIYAQINAILSKERNLSYGLSLRLEQFINVKSVKLSKYNKMSAKQILYKILKPYLLQKQGLKLAKFNKSSIFSTIAIILRNLAAPTPATRQIDIILNNEILILQRVQNGKLYSGEICLPGGKVEEGESILETAVRETEEETGLQLQEADLVGIFNQAFIASRRTSHTLFTYTAVFYLTTAQEIKLNQGEISSYRWLPVRHFMNDEVYRTISVPAQIYKYLDESQDLKGIKGLVWPAVDVGLSRTLYGFTLYILAFFMSRLEGSLKLSIRRLSEKEKEGAARQQTMRLLKQEYKVMERYLLKVKDLYLKSFNDVKIIWREDAKLTSQEKEAATAMFNIRMSTICPERPHL